MDALIADLVRLGHHELAKALRELDGDSLAVRLLTHYVERYGLEGAMLAKGAILGRKPGAPPLVDDLALSSDLLAALQNEEQAKSLEKAVARAADGLAPVLTAILRIL